MIEGFKLKVTCAELRKHLVGRAAYHRQRATEKEGELPNLRTALDNIKRQGVTVVTESIASMGKGGYNLDTEDPIKKLEQDIQDHRNKSLVFFFFSEHLFDEDYTLVESDLVRLEILKR